MISLKLLDGSEQNNGNWTIAWNKCMYMKITLFPIHLSFELAPPFMSYYQ